MTPMLEKYKKMTAQNWLNGREAVLSADAPNDYHTDRLQTIPAGTHMICDFAGDFGMYAMADISGVIHRVKISVEHFHKIDFATDDDTPPAA